MKLIDVKLSRFIPGPAGEVFDVWFDPASPGGPWHGAKKVIMNVAVDGMFYFGIERAQVEVEEFRRSQAAVSLLGHFGRFTAIEGRAPPSTRGCPSTRTGIETTVSVTFEPREGGTQMTIVHRGIPDDEMGRGHEARVDASCSREVERALRGDAD